jgi:hypothetical protein|tara:strand:+ start:1048 stop:1311 length:264 start_codon:yes stop_codon:yes gene_type:complete
MEKELYHTFSEGERKAEVFKTVKGFEVELYEKDDWSATRKVHGHSETYAENTAENWVQGIFDLEPPVKEGSFYGYRQRSDNYYEGDD